MRRATLLLLGILTAAAAGCQESGFDESRETARPLKVQHAGDPPRESKVPGQAERPAALTEDALGDAIALGLRPVLAAVPGGRAPNYVANRLQGVRLIEGSSPSVDLEALLAAGPDVILGSEERHDGIYRSLVKVAPTVLTPGTSGDWKRGVRLHGEALGRVNDAEALLVDWDRRVAAVRDALGTAAATPSVSVVLVEPEGLRAAGKNSFAGTVLADVRLGRPTEQEESTEPSFAVDAGELGSLEADVILLSVAPGAAAKARRVQSQTAWRSLGGRVERADPAIWWGPGGILAGRAALADLQRILQP